MWWIGMVLGLLMKYASLSLFPSFLTHSSTSPGSINSLRQIFTQTKKTSDLHALHCKSSNTIVQLELEPILKGTGQYGSLCLLDKERGEDAKLLDASKYVFCVSFHPESSTEVFVSWTGSPMQNGQKTISQTRYHPYPLSSQAIGN